MKALIIYDSFFGNTEKIAKEIAGACTGPYEVDVVKIESLKPDQLKEVGLLIIGSPTRGFNASKPIQEFLKSLPAGSLNGVKVAVFDTRMNFKEEKNWFLRNFLSLFDYAATPISKGLKKSGGQLIVEPGGFYVVKSEGPLKEGELERAHQWAEKLYR